MDFLHDGGETVKPPREFMEKYLEGILRFLRSIDMDLVLLQEVDKDCDRTYHIDEADEISRIFPDYAWSFAPNCTVKFAPVPLQNQWVRSSLVR
ncbi:MAG TPA: hypothetical protein ENG15_02995 [Thermotoga sp.]|nr:MAG: hypothetical protein DRP23_04105 [Thermotogota bacterium]HDG61953.1 hypothetical protein [Thermotoga sp.]